MTAGRRPPVPHHVHLFLGLLEFPCNMAPGFPRANDPRERKMETTMPFITFPGKAHTVFLHIVYIRSKSLSAAPTWGRL